MNSTPLSALRARRGAREVEPDADLIVPVSFAEPSMGGTLTIHLDPASADGRDPAVAARLVIADVNRWAARLTRHSDDSDLSRLNADPRLRVAVRPMLAAALFAGRIAAEYGEGLVDVTLLDQRLAAESGEPLTGDAAVAAPTAGAAGRGSTGAATASTRDWSLEPGRRGSALVARPAGLRFDLGGVGKGWLADRALARLDSWPSAIVDADGDLAVACAPGRAWEIGVGDPRDNGTDLATLRLAARADGPPLRWGVATSGVSIHRWTSGGTIRHHLIDPRTGLPAQTDVVQATVIATSALRAEALAKAAVIAGTGAGFAMLERARLAGAIMLTDRGEVLALPSTLRLLAS
jgi:FAD:protein FMN transferase